jgi:hypothetical protein
MTHSAQNPDPSSRSDLKPALKRLIRRVVPPPGAAAPQDEQACDVLYHGDDTARFFGMRAQAHQLAADPAAFIRFFADFLASEAMEFDRLQRLRAAAVNLQISDDYQRLTESFENIDDHSRQYLAYHKIASDPSCRVISQDADRAFRRTAQSHKIILQSSRLAKR